MKAYAEETFGPVVSVYPFDGEEDAVERANATRYGLSASIWSRDTGRAVRLAQRISAGSVNVNEAYAATWATVDSPIGGLKESGLRPRHGAEGILKFTDSQTVAVERLLPIAPPRGIAPAVYARWMTRPLRVLRRPPLVCRVDPRLAVHDFEDAEGVGKQDHGTGRIFVALIRAQNPTAAALQVGLRGRDSVRRGICTRAGTRRNRRKTFEACVLRVHRTVHWTPHGGSNPAKRWATKL